ncbi:MAG: hypothetical protein PHG43_13470, partial [Phenylobacterium sp.]|nr:hypothetical protein [Phenylobacterium sp.]
EYDPQDQAEARDESMTVDGEGDDMRNFEELPDVMDLTQAIGDRSDDGGLALDADEFDEDAFGDGDMDDEDEDAYAAGSADSDIYDDEDANDIVDDFDEDLIAAEEIEGLNEVRDADEATGGEDDFTNFQAKAVGDEDLRRMGYLDDADNPGADPARRG